MSTPAQTEKKIWIPEISDESLNELASRIRPIHNFGGIRRYVKPDKEAEDYLRGTAYAWSPKPSASPLGRLKSICDITTYHTYAFYDFFKPTIAEVVAQITEEHLKDVVAFEIIDSPDDVNDLNRKHEALNAGYHVATTRLFKKA